MPVKVLDLIAMCLVACGVDERPVAPDAGTQPSAASDAPTDLPDDGFGFACRAVWQPDRLLTECTSSEGLAGFCAAGACRRRCSGEIGQVRTCPAGQSVIPTVERECYCEPAECTVSACSAIDRR